MAKEKILKLWSLRGSVARGNEWVLEREVKESEALQWIAIFEKDEPGVLFLASARKPAIKGRK